MHLQQDKFNFIWLSRCESFYIRFNFVISIFFRPPFLYFIARNIKRILFLSCTCGRRWNKSFLSFLIVFFSICLLRFRVYKKTSSNQLLTLYLGTRELISRAGVVDPIKGIIYIDPRVIESNQKVYCQLTLTFRWDRADCVHIIY